MLGRRAKLSSVLFLILLPSMASATDPRHEVEETAAPFDLYNKVSLSLERSTSQDRDSDFLSSVTMTRLPYGSLLTRYDGMHGLIAKQLHGEYRRFVRRAVRRGWYVLDSDVGAERRLYQSIDQEDVNLQSNGNWWWRSWWESLPPEKGGAPREPYIHTYGVETSWRVGSFTITNTLKFRFDYVGFFSLNPDPEMIDHPKRIPPVVIDVFSTEESTPQRIKRGTYVRFDIKPRLQISMPSGGDTAADALRGASVQVSVDFYFRHRQVMKGEFEFKWQPEDGLSGAFEVSLLTW